MKKAICATALCMAMVFFAGCAQQVASSEESTSSAISAAPAISEVAEVRDIAPITYCSSYSRACTENGFYFLEAQTSNTQNIMYLDFSSKQITVLCNRPECAHSDDTCNAWVRNSYNTPFLLTCSQGLLLVYPGSASVNTDNASELLARIDLVELNGTNRKTLHTFDSGEMFTRYFALSEDALYYQLETYTAQGTKIDRLESIDLQSGATTKISEITGKSVYFMGAFQDMLIMKEIDTSGFDKAQTADEQQNALKAQQHIVFTINAGTGEQKQLFAWPQSERTELFSDSGIYTITYGQAPALHFIDYETGTETEILEAEGIRTLLLNYTTMDNLSRVKYQLFFAADNILVVKTTILGDQPIDTQDVLFSVDINEKMIHVVSLQTQAEGAQYPLQIEAVTSAGLLVIPSYSYQPVTAISSNGTIMTYNDLKENYGFISLEDFCASRANYQLCTYIQ